MGYLSEIDDPRKPSNGTLHDFREILVISIAAMLSDSDTVEDIAYWARKKEAWLRRFLVLKNGVPSEETFLRIFRVIDPKQFETAFRRWVGRRANGDGCGDRGDQGEMLAYGITLADLGGKPWGSQS